MLALPRPLTSDALVQLLFCECVGIHTGSMPSATGIPIPSSAHVQRLREFTKDVRHLKPFRQQVAGHPETFWEVGPRLLAKPIRDTCHREQMFYHLLARLQGVFPHAVPSHVDQRGELHASHGLGTHGDSLRALLPFLPTYYGDIFVTADATTGEAAASTHAPQAVDVLTRQYRLGVPERFSRVDLAKSVSPAAGGRGTDGMGRPAAADGTVRRRQDTHADMFGWVHRTNHTAPIHTMSRRSVWSGAHRHATKCTVGGCVLRVNKACVCCHADCAWVSP